MSKLAALVVVAEKKLNLWRTKTHGELFEQPNHPQLTLLHVRGVIAGIDARATRTRAPGRAGTWKISEPDPTIVDVHIPWSLIVQSQYTSGRARVWRVLAGCETAHCCSMAAQHTHRYLVITMTETTRLLGPGDRLWPVYPISRQCYRPLSPMGFPTTLEKRMLPWAPSWARYSTERSLNREMSACSRAGRSLSRLILLQGQIQNLFGYVIKPAATDIAFPNSDMGEIPSVEKATYSCWRISGDSHISWAIFSRIAVAINILFYCNDVSFRPHNRIGRARLNVCVDSGFCCQVHILVIVERVGESSMPSIMIETESRIWLQTYRRLGRDRGTFQIHPYWPQRR